MTLRDAVKLLAASGVEDAKNDVLTLWSHVSGVSRASLMFSLDTDISRESCYEEFLSLIGRRKDREPLQYILGKWSFFGDEYKVSPDCLIPRSDTETLVEVLLSEIKDGAKITDLCCGSGCIGIAAVKNSSASCFSVDISRSALDIAKENALTLGVSDRMRFELCDVLDKSAVKSLFGDAKFDIIASNPPYIKPSAKESLSPELSYEPDIALFGGEDGMLFYRSITENFPLHLNENGALIYEIGFDEEDEIKQIADESGMSCRIVTDIEGRARVAILKKL